MSDDAPVHSLTLLQRVLLLLTLVSSTTIYSASVLISSALLPQLQGALSATQDEVSWVMTFNIVATAVATPAAGWLADRFGQRADHDLVRAGVHHRHLHVRRLQLAGGADRLAHPAGCRRRAAGAARPDHPARQLPAPAARH